MLLPFENSGTSCIAKRLIEFNPVCDDEILRRSLFSVSWIIIEEIIIFKVEERANLVYATGLVRKIVTKVIIFEKNYFGMSNYVEVDKSMIGVRTFFFTKYAKYVFIESVE